MDGEGIRYRVVMSSVALTPPICTLRSNLLPCFLNYLTLALPLQRCGRSWRVACRVVTWMRGLRRLRVGARKGKAGVGTARGVLLKSLRGRREGSREG